ncbi:MAG: hypothetical protein ACXVFQ_18895 [Solirubrobacteraceae bacterium]
MALPAAAAAAPAPPFPDARLQGSFELAGRVTAAHAVKGEHVGQTVARVWSFSSTCPAAGQCAPVALVRSRAAASDSLVLRRTAPGRYRGSGRFFLPLRCAGRVYARGEEVPFTISVQITLAVPFGSGTVATRVSATYVNSRRINRTPCVAALGHDAASYHGHLQPIAAI